MGPHQPAHQTTADGGAAEGGVLTELADDVDAAGHRNPSPAQTLRLRIELR
ncbi:MAG: hypothetical protein HY905_23805 [Deltaproteobacteria bacterium]|nr:hypothetical protein [Deltaproteobacteria bacterium]